MVPVCSFVLLLFAVSLRTAQGPRRRPVVEVRSLMKVKKARCGSGPRDPHPRNTVRERLSA